MEKRTILFLLFLLIVICVSFSGYKIYDYAEHNPAFCSSCHIMKKAWDAWKINSHKSIHCKKCHTQDFAARTRIIWQWAIKDIKNVGPHTKLDKTVCEKCHLNGDPKHYKLIKETAGHELHVLQKGKNCLDCHFANIHQAEPEREKCEKCHEVAKNNIGKMGDFHCLTCHNFLAGGKKGDKILPVSKRCLSCHEPYGYEKTAFPEDRPMNFECPECHKPHTKPFLDEKDCLTCHDIANDKTHAKPIKSKKSRCVDCHRPHKWVYGK